MTPMKLTREQIMEIQPHRDPILLVDEVLELVPGDYVIGRFYVDPEMPVLKGHFPGDPTLPGVYTMEASGAFKGRYHVLAGKLSPGKQTGTGELRIAALLHRVRRDGITEVLLALSTDLEGDATAAYIAEKLRDGKVNITRLAFGLPCGSGIAYADALTLRRAINGRQRVTDSEDEL